LATVLHLADTKALRISASFVASLAFGRLFSVPPHSAPNAELHARWYDTT
jgi:hypothetical protein